jgi:positive regulator of sigma E activity
MNYKGLAAKTLACTLSLKGGIKVEIGLKEGDVRFAEIIINHALRKRLPSPCTFG